MPDGEIEIESDFNNVTVCKSGKTRFKIFGLQGDEYPVIPPVEKTSSFTLQAKKLREMIRQTIFSVAVDDTKPVLTGELLQYKDNALHIVAVDGFRISYKREDLDNNSTDSANMSVVVPAKALHELSRILPGDGDEELKFYFTDKRIVFELAKYTFVSRLLEGDFIRYDQIFNEDFTTNVTVGRAAFLTGLERATLIARDNKKSPVKLDIKENSIEITSNTEMGTSFDEVQADVDGNTIEIAFNPRYLIEAIKAIDEERIVMRFTTGLSPCILKGAESDTGKYLILPLRIRG